jgi:hypothetical protein
MADLYLKRLETERKSLWATCRLKGLPAVSAERQRIAELDRLIAEHKARKPAPTSPEGSPATGRSASSTST